MRKGKELPGSSIASIISQVHITVGGIGFFRGAVTGQVANAWKWLNVLDSEHGTCSVLAGDWGQVCEHGIS